MRKVLIIGIGPGNPDYLTVQAINALNRVDVFFVPDKGAEKADLQQLRLDICHRYIKGDDYRLVEFKMPVRSNDPADYKRNVDDWHSRIEQEYERLLGREVGEGECAGFLIWGDPTLYDSVLRMIEKIRSTGVIAFDYEVIPGISSVQVLAARHRIALNRIGESVNITTGRKLAEKPTIGAENVVVMLDGEQSFKKVESPDVEIFWGAYVGTADEILVSGRLADVAGEIEVKRARARAEKGWIMDTYLLRGSRET
ncbi:MAG: precorrin-6A synthase (deacetylating) [Hyphomicrobiales bacterium]|nr:precorrin-6A synthase (deacetylating) [Hyphomicrobiales bacterium]MDE2374351.1 precorrin-6A synthase (deacetylating) [Hyphomicrobiales bacterium]